MKYAFLLLSLLASPASAEIYKWRDASGVLHFSDSPDKARSAETVELRINSYQAISYESLTNNKATDKVVMYSTSWCGYCRKARKYFSAQGIAFTELDIEKNQQAKRAYDKLGGKGVPIILVGNKRMNGFSEAGFQRIYKTDTP